MQLQEITQENTIKIKPNFFARHFFALSLLLAIVIGFVLRYYGLGKGFFDIDEVWQYQSSSYNFGQIIPKLWPDHSPLFFFLSHVFLKLHPTRDEAYLRFPAMIFGVLFIPAIYLLAKSLFNRTTALVAAILATIWPVLITYSQEYRMYTLVALLCTLSAYFLFEGFKTNNWLHWLGFAVTNVINLYTHYIALFLVTAEAFYVGLYLAIFLLQLFKILPAKIASKFIYAQTSLKTFILTIASFILVGLLYLPWLSHFFLFLNTPGYGLARGTSSVGLGGLITIFQGTGLGSFLYDAWLTLILLIVGYLYSFKVWPKSGLLLLALWAFPMAVILILPGGNTFVGNYRYLIFLAPSVICLLAVALVELANTLTILCQKVWKIHFQKLPLIFTVSLLLVVALLATQILVTFVYPEAKLEGGDAALYINQNSRPGDVVVNIDNPIFIQPVIMLDYYMAKFNPNVAFNATSSPMSAAVLSSLTNTTTKRVWLTLQFPWSSLDVRQLLKYPPTDFEVNCFEETCVLLDQHPEKNAPLQRFQVAMSDYESFYPEVYVPADITAQFLLNQHSFDQKPNLLPNENQNIPMPWTTSIFSKKFANIDSGHFYLASFCYTGKPRLRFTATKGQEYIAAFPSDLGYQPADYAATAYNLNNGSCQTDAFAFYVPPTADTLYLALDNIGFVPASIQNFAIREVR